MNNCNPPLYIAIPSPTTNIVNGPKPKNSPVSMVIDF